MSYIEYFHSSNTVLISVARFLGFFLIEIIEIRLKVLHKILFWYKKKRKKGGAFMESRQENSMMLIKQANTFINFLIVFSRERWFDKMLWLRGWKEKDTVMGEVAL